MTRQPPKRRRVRLEVRPPGWTTAVGLGSGHQHARDIALLNLRDGIDQCPYCHRPMWRRQALDLDDYPPRILAQRMGVTPVKRLAHARCNRSAGARLGNRLRKLGVRRTTRRPRPQPKRRGW